MITEPSDLEDLTVLGRAGKRIYGYQNERYYEFMNDNAGGFHGYPVNEVELPVSVKQQLRDRGLIQ
jgi:hypothetical protein